MAMVCRFLHFVLLLSINYLIIDYQTVKLPTQQMADQSSLETHDKVFNSLLVHSYNMFRLFMGTMKSALQVSTEPEVEIEQLKIRTAYFYSKVSFSYYSKN